MAYYWIANQKLQCYHSLVPDSEYDNQLVVKLSDGLWKLHGYVSRLWMFQIQIVAKTAGMHRNEWVENADRFVAGFLEMFEESCHKMVSSSLSLSLTHTHTCTLKT